MHKPTSTISIQVLWLILFFSIIIPSLNAQIIYGGTGWDGMGIPAKLWDASFQVCSCDFDFIADLEWSLGDFNGPEGDLALCPDGALYTSMFGDFFSIDPVTGLVTLIPLYPEDLTIGLDGLACAGNGILYGADEWIGNNNLYRYDLSNDTAIILGQMPFYCIGGMFFYNDLLYMFTPEGLALIDTINPMNSSLLFTLPSNTAILGSTAYGSCNMAIVLVDDFETSGRFYALYSLLDGTIQPLCDAEGHYMTMTSDAEFVDSPCELQIDLDCDDSSGATGSDFNSPDFTCLIEEGVSIADIDARILSGYTIDYITLNLTTSSGTLPDDPEEVLDFNSNIPNINVSGEGTTFMTLSNVNDLASIQNFLDALRAVVYIDHAADPIEGERIVEVQFFAGNEVSNIALAYIQVIDLPLIEVDLGPDVTICEGTNITLDAGVSNAQYDWSTNEITKTIVVNIPGEYNVIVSDGARCPNQDVIEIFSIPVVLVTLEGDSVTCEDEPVTLTINVDAPFPVDIEITADPGSTNSFDDVLGNYSFIDFPESETVYWVSLVTPPEDACIVFTDSVQYVIVNPAYQIEDTTTICEGDSIRLGSSWETEQGIYEILHITINGCDSLVITSLTVLPREQIFYQSTTCDSLQAGIFTHYLDNPNGCDTVVQTTITLLTSLPTLLNSSSCIASETGIYTDTLVNIFGCDSVIMTTIEYLVPIDTTEITINTCDSSLLGIHFEILAGADGCDSIIAIMTQASLPDTTILHNTSCYPNEIGVFETWSEDVMGCESLLINMVTPGHGDTSYVFLTSCDSSSLGVTEELFISSKGCDSLVITTITYSEKDSLSIAQHSCNPSDTGTVINTFVNQFGCDSIVIIQTTLYPTHNFQFFSSSCNPADTGVFILTLNNQFGCDSIITETVAFLQSHALTIQSNSCHGADTGTFIFNLINQHGCDSIVTEIVSLVVIDTVILSDLTCDVNLTDTTTTMYTTADGCDSLVIEMISLYPLPMLNIISNADFNGFDVSCADANDGSISAIVNGIGPIAYLWNTNSANQNLNDVGGGDYQVTVTDGNGCEISSSITLTEPEPFLIGFMISPPECFIESTGSIGINPSGGVAPYTYSINGGSPQASPTFSGLEGGLYQLTAFDANQCEASELIWIKEPLRVEVSLGNDQMTYPGDTILLQAIVNIPFDSITLINWEGIDSIPCVNCLTQTIVPVLTTSYSIEVVSVDGCSDNDDMTVFIDEENEIYVPNIFSPNDDGNNDRLLISAGRGVKEITSFHVFDRWGNLVFESIQFQPGDPVYAWDGRMNDQQMNQGVFTYKLLALLRDGTNEIRYGDITLLR